MSHARESITGGLRWHGTPVFIVALVCGVSLRLLAAREPLWLDEVLALRWIEVLPSFNAIFTGYFSENNHFLQSGWLWFVQDFEKGYIKRAFSLFCSLSLLLMLFFFALKEGGWRRIFFLLCSFSYFFILYGSEARGYSPLLLGMYLTFEQGERVVQRYSPRNVMFFWLASLFSILSHISAFSFLGALLLGLWARGGFLRAALLGTPSVISLIAIWLFFLKKLTEAGGDIGNEINAVLDLFSIGFGGPVVTGSLSGIIGLLVAFATFLWLPKLLFQYVKRREENWFFFLSGIYLLPLVSWVGYGPEYTYPRHFLPALFVAFLFLSRIIDDALRSGGGRRMLAGCFLVFFILGNTMHGVSLVRYGRGDYRIVREMLEQEPAPLVFDHAYRHQTMLNFAENQSRHELYRYPIEEQPPFPEWARLRDWPVEHPYPSFLWIVTQGPVQDIPSLLKREKLSLASVIPAAPLSGWSIYLYRYPMFDLQKTFADVRKSSAHE